MEKTLDKPALTRPLISDYAELRDFVRDMLHFRKRTERSFSVLAGTKNLRRISPALVSLIVKGERKLTLDRVDEFAKLLNLNPQEKSYLKTWLTADADGNGHDLASLKSALPRNRKDVGIHILNDWLNIYVKDCFQLAEVQKNTALIYKQLSLYASPQRIDKSIQFLLREGHLRKTPDGRIVTETPLALAQSTVPSRKIRQFHKRALGIAKASLDLFPTSERMANTLILPLNAKSYQELLHLIQDFAERTQDFAAQNSDSGERLYQLVLNLCPTGGKFE